MRAGRGLVVHQARETMCGLQGSRAALKLWTLCNGCRLVSSPLEVGGSDPADRCHTYRDQALQFWAAGFRRAFARR